MNVKKIIAALLTSVMICTSFSIFAEETEQSLQSSVQLSNEYMVFDQIAEYVSEHYLNSDLSKSDIMLMGISNYLKDNTEVTVELLKSMLTSLDPYSDFFTAEEYINYLNQINQTFYGIGVYLQENDGYVEITGFIEEGGTAEQAGFMTGDKIVGVDGMNVYGKSLDDIRNMIVGELNTTVQITVLRGSEEIELTGTRVAVNQSTVSGGIMKGNIGYVAIKSFGTKTASEFASIMQLLQESDVKKLILDLRDNPGGIVDAATDIAEMIVPSGDIVKVSYRDSDAVESYKSSVTNAPFNMIVLVNENTASSSEILASAIQDSGAGKLLGTQTYGKAVIQQLYKVGDGRFVLKLTTGQYLTRNGREINEVGLEPDFEVTNYKKNIDTTQYTSLDFQNRYSLGQNNSAVKGAKERLKLLGYYSGNASDTVFDRELQTAVKAFQEEIGLAPSGVLDIATQVKLKEQFEKLETIVDRQLQTAYEKFGGNIEDLY